MHSLTARMFLLALISMTAVRAAEPVVLPTVSFDNLSKNRVTLPADLHTDRNVLLLYFELTQQADVDNWNSIIDRWRASDPSLTSYTSLVSSQKNFLSRWWQNASMRSASDPSRWPTTVPLYVNKRDFEHRLDIHSEKQVVLLLLDRKGHVLGQVSGRPTDNSRTAMENALRAAGASSIPAPQTTAPPH